MIGRTLAHYRIVEKLGEGGEVWRARDVRLNRDVALKLLPATFTQDPERLARLEREARFLASLNHPNIAAIYGLEELFEGARVPQLVVPACDLSPDGQKFRMIDNAEARTVIQIHVVQNRTADLKRLVPLE